MSHAQLVIPLLLLLASSAEAADESVDAILAKAIDVQKKHEDAGIAVKYDYNMVSVLEKLDKNGDVKEVERELYKSNHIENVAYERLVEKDGRRLTDKELEKEDERERKFRRKLSEGEAKHNDADERVAFDEELLSRYDIHLDATRRLDGRDCYVMFFRPKAGKLPNKRQMDRILNKAEGYVWIDRDTYQIARLEFELTDKVRVWWGMLGSVSSMRGRLTRRALADGVWLPQEFNFYLKGRMLFRSLHLRQLVQWEDYAERDTIKTTVSSTTNP